MVSWGGDKGSAYLQSLPQGTIHWLSVHVRGGIWSPKNQASLCNPYHTDSELGCITCLDQVMSSNLTEAEAW